MFKRSYLISITAFILALLYLILVKSNNLGFSPDAVTYLEGAQNIKAGKGYLYDNGRLINHWPPLYSIFLAIFSIFTKVSLLQSAKYLHLLLIIGVIFLLGRIFKHLKINKYLSTILIFLFFISAASKIFLWQLTEGLFTFFLILSYYIILLWTTSRNKKVLILLGAISALLFLTRFAGIGFIGAYGCFILVVGKGGLRKKFLILLLYLIPVILLVMPWFIYTNIMDSNVQDRIFDIHLITAEKLKNFISVIKNWFFGTYLAVKLAPWFALIILFSFLKFRKKILNHIPQYLLDYRTPLLLAFISITFYSFFIFISASFFDRGIPFDNRMLYPLFPFLIIIIAISLQFFFHRNMKLIFFSLTIFLLISFTTSGIPVYKDYYENGLGFTQKKWIDSPTINYVLNNNNITYYSNATEILKLNTGEKSRKFPNNSRKEKLKEIKKELESGSARILILKKFSWPNYLVPEAIILKEFKDFSFIYLQDGFIIKGPSNQ